MTTASNVDVDDLPTPTADGESRRAREFYRYLQPDNLIDPSLRRRPSTFDLKREQIPSLSQALAPYCQLTALRCRAPKAMLNVIDRDVMYFLAEASLAPTKPGDDNHFQEFIEDPIMMTCTSTPLKGRICEMTIRLDKAAPGGPIPMFVLPDLSKSAFSHLSVIAGPPYYRFYAGTPITTRDGINIGSLAVMDTEAREGLTEAEEDFLGRTAAQVMTYLETNRHAIEGRRSRRLAEGLEGFTAGKKSLADTSAGSLAERTKKRRSKVAYGLGPASDHENDDHRPSLDPSAPSRHSGAFPDTRDSELSTSEQSTDTEPQAKEPDTESRSHSRTFARAANLLREAFDDLGEDGSVVFLNLKGRLDNGPRSPTIPERSWSSNSLSNVAATKKASLGEILPSSAAAPVLAASSASLPFLPDEDGSLPSVSLSEESLRKLMARYPGGHLWTFDDAGRLSSSEEDLKKTPSETSNQHRRSSRRKRTELHELKAAFPHARQLMFAPVWDSNVGAFVHAVFIAASLDTRSLSAATELPFLNSFCSTVMAECSRLDTVKADKQKSDFVGTISHEMRSPLHGILASVEFLAETELTGFQQSLIDTVDACGRTLLDTINHVLDFSKINSFQKQWQASNKRGNHLTRRKHHLGPDNTSKSSSHGAPPLLQLYGVTDLSAVLEEVVEGLVLGQTFTSGIDMTDVSREARGRGKKGFGETDGIPIREEVEVVLDIQQADWAFVTQPGAVRRIVLNLTGNALKYTPSGSITIRLELKTRETEEKGSEMMAFTVTDTGRGISQEFLNSKLFVPFAQENALAPGTGLGLSIVQSIVTMLGGTIEVTSEVNHGTTAQVMLPLKRPLPGQTSTINTPHSGGTANSLGSNPDESIILLQHQGSDTRVAYYRPNRSSDDQLVKAVSRYVGGWYGLELVDPQLVGSAHVVILDEEDLESLVGKISGTPGHHPAFVMMCSVAARHSASYIRSLEDQIHGAVEFVAKPVGPYKLAKSIRLALQKLRTVKPTFLKAPSLSVIPEQPSPMPSAQAAEAPAEDSLANGLYEMDLSSPGHNEAGQVVQATETLAVSQSSQNAQMAITSPTRPVTSPTPKKEGESFPFPEQDSSETLANGGNLQGTDRVLPAPAANGTTQKQRKDSKPKTPALGEPDIDPRILLVDDNKINLKLLQTFLKSKRKYTKIDLAEDGQLAVEAFISASTDSPYSIIFMDISMPVMNGFEATRAIRELEVQKGIEGGGSMVIALTGLASGKDQAEGFDAGVDIYLTKPVSFKEVGKLLDNWEAHQRLKEEGEGSAAGDGGEGGQNETLQSLSHGALTGPGC